MVDLLTTWSLDSRQFQAGLRRQQADVQKATVSVDRELSSVGSFLGRGLAGSVGGVLTAVGAFRQLRTAVAETRAEMPELARNISALEYRADRFYRSFGQGLTQLLDIGAGLIGNSGAVQAGGGVLSAVGDGAVAGLLRLAGVPFATSRFITQAGANVGNLIETNRLVSQFSVPDSAVNRSGGVDEQFAIDRARIESERRAALSGIQNRGLPAQTELAVTNAANRLFDGLTEALQNRRLQDALEEELKEQEQARTIQKRILDARKERATNDRQARAKMIEELQSDSTQARSNQLQLRGLRRRLRDLSSPETTTFLGGESSAFGVGSVFDVAPGGRQRIEERNDILEAIQDLTREQNELLRRIVNNGFGLAP